MAIDPKLIDRLLADHGKRPEDIAGENGLLTQLTKAILERALLTAPKPGGSQVQGRYAPVESSLAAGDVLALDNPASGVAIFPVVRLDQAPAQELPVWEGWNIPVQMSR